MYQRASVLFSPIFGCVVSLLCAGPLAAETIPPSDRPSEDALEEIVVTGTRLPMPLIDVFAPVTVLSRIDIERRGANSIGDVLQSLPMNAGSRVNTNVNAGGAEPGTEGTQGDGSVRIALHGHSTLVLLNGRRFPNSGLGADASVDLNTLPISWIDRVEVLTSGASAVYGADAVGGVVNIVTRREIDGLELSGSRSITERGDGEIISGRAAIGFGLFEGAWGFGVDYANQDGVTLDRRNYSAVPVGIVDRDGTRGYWGNPATPQGRFLVPAGNTLGLAPGFHTRVDGAVGQTAADYRPYVPNVDGFNYAPFNYSQTPNERTSIWLIGSQPLGERTSFFVEGLIHHRTSAQQSAPASYFASSGFAALLEDGSIGIPADNYYNPFGVDLNLFARRFVELGNRRVSEDVDLWRALIGFEGTIADWKWTVTLAEAESDATMVETGVLLQSRLVSALGPSGPDIDGRIVCGPPDPATGRVPTTQIVPGCVPVNLFGGPGSITREQLDYLSPRDLSHVGTNEQRTAELILSGRWGQMYGRDLQWVVGASYRREAGSLVLDPLRVMEFGEPVLPGGNYDATELFAEVQVPLLQDRPWARELVSSLGVRWSNFSSFAQHTSWQAGLRWQPADELTLRANYADVFRAPTLWDLHDPQVRFDAWFDFDPCGNDPTPTQRANCAASGVPGGAYVQTDEPFSVIAGGNPDLEPETGHSVGVGLVYTPGWAGGLSVSVDLFQVELSGYIWQAFVDQVLFECADNGIRDACAAIRRYPDGSIEQVSTLNENFGGLETRGVDVAIDFNVTTRLGDVSSKVLASYLEGWDEQPFDGGEVISHAGHLGYPRWRGLGSVDWRYGPWRASYAAEYIGSYEQLVRPFPIGPVAFAPFDRRVEAILYHDIEGAYEFGMGFTVRAAITNVTDQDPPFVSGESAGNTDAGTYRLLGRSYFLELRYESR